jgi:hypothetical protein
VKATHRTAPNPFVSRRVQPGAIPYWFAGAESITQLVERLRVAGGRGQIIGPHGTGKSTLLETLVPELRRAGWEAVRIALHDNQRFLPSAAVARLRQAERDIQPCIVLVDGYEQLCRPSRWGLAWRCWRRAHGLLVTAHEDVGFPDIYRTHITMETALHVLAHLTKDRASPVTEGDLASRLAARTGNLREALFDLYDLHEQRTRSGAVDQVRQATG